MTPDFIREPETKEEAMLMAEGGVALLILSLEFLKFTNTDPLTPEDRELLHALLAVVAKLPERYQLGARPH